MMRILMLSPFPPPSGGIATWTMKYREFCEENYIDANYVNTALIGKRAKDITQKRSLANEFFRAIRIIRDLREKLRKVKPDIVHINTNCSKIGVYRDLLCTVLARKRSNAIIVHCRCNIQDQLENSRAANRAFKKMVQASDVVITLNSPSLHYVQALAHQKACILPNFIEANAVVSARETKPELKTAAFVGHVQRSKGIFELLCLAEQNPDVVFNLVGPVSKEVNEQELPKNVVLLGERNHEDVVRCLDEADAFVFPTYTEGFANVLLEAMARGLPIITTDVGANADMLEGKGGLIVPARDVERLVEATKAIKSPHVREAMSHWNIKKVKENYTVDIVMRELMIIYEEVMK